VDTKGGVCLRAGAKAEVEDLVLEEVPDVAYEDRRLSRQIEQIRDAVEMAFLPRPTCSASTSCARQRASCSWPTRCGKR